MARGSNQKLKILYLLEILMENTDEEHHMPMKDIIERLAEVSVSAERKSIYSDIEELNRFGFDIANDQKGYFIASRRFEAAELKMLADCVSASKFITEKKSAELIKKLESLTGRFEAAKLRRQIFIADRVKAVNEHIYYSVDAISEAVNDEKKIAFRYFTYDAEKNKVFKNGGEEYVVSPYALTVSDENYYLISHCPKHENLTHFRVDRMTGIRELDERADSVEKIMGKGFSIGAYAKKVFSMYAGESVRVNLICDEGLINAVIDRFGEDVFIGKAEDGKVTVSATVDISPTFFAWVFTFGGRMRITGPEKVKNEFNETVKRFLET